VCAQCERDEGSKKQWLKMVTCQATCLERPASCGLRDAFSEHSSPRDVTTATCVDENTTLSQQNGAQG
jgi:hypothetical protein